MKFNIIKIVKNESLERLLSRYNWIVGSYAHIKKFLSIIDPDKLSVANNLLVQDAEYWNKIAEILLNLEKYEDFDTAIDECFKVLGGRDDETYELMKRIGNREQRGTPEKYSGLEIEENSTDEIYMIFYLKEMYDRLHQSSLPYVDEILKNEMFVRLNAEHE